MKKISFLLLAGLLIGCGGGSGGEGGGGGGGDATNGSTPFVNVLAATSTSTNGTTLNGNVTPNGLATNAWFEWGTDSALSTSASTPAQSIGPGQSIVPVSIQITGLAENTKYYFRVCASNSKGGSESSITSFTTSSPGSVRAVTIHADPGLPADCVGSYNPATRSCGGGTAVGYRTLNGAATAAQAGDTVLLRGGTFQEALKPPRSGAPDNVITFKNYPGETPVVSGVNEPAIYFLSRSYLVIEGLTVTDVSGWGRIESSSYNTFRNNQFARATARGTTGGLKFVKSTFNKVLNNTLDDGNDSLVLQESDRNLLQGNTFTKARHSLLSVRCSNFNVIRGNRFYNEDQKAAEIYDCEGTSDAPVKYDATKHNLFEGNAFTHTMASGQDYNYNGIQYAGQNGIVRKNVFYDNQGGALNFQVYSNEALYNYSNRVFNNTFYSNACYGMSASSNSDPSRYFGNIVKNNIFYKNVDCSGGVTQTSIGNPSAVQLESNAIVTTSPLFVDETGRDLHLQSGSPMIDAGAFSARTVGTGNGTVLPLDDVGYFYDGFGIAEETGDLIRFEGQSVTARVVGIDYTGKTLTLDRSIAWSDGQYLHLEYTGLRPDMGAFEYQ